MKGREAEEDTKEAGCGRKCEGWIRQGRHTLPIKIECWHESDCSWLKVNLTTITCWGYYQILNIGVSLSCPLQ